MPGDESDETLSPQVRPCLARKARLRKDRVSGAPLLLYPEGVLWLNATGAAIVGLCDGHRGLTEVVAELGERYAVSPEVLREEVDEFLNRLRRCGLLRFCGERGALAPCYREEQGANAPRSPGTFVENSNRAAPRALGLLAELTYRCPLHCPYCSNPTKFSPAEGELTAAEWQRVLSEAGELGVLHVHFSGGEPLLRPDLPALVRAAREAGLYTNLLTSGVGLSRARGERLRDAGLDSVQISFQADEAGAADAIAGAPAHARKLEAARLVGELGWPLTLNVVLHRGNIDRIESLVALAEELGAERLELANTQYYGWALRNRASLLPSRTQAEGAQAVATAAAERLRGRMQVVYVLPDYLGDRPKPCMNGWGQRHLTVNPVGDVLPCPTAGAIVGLRFENVQRRSLRWIWEESEAFNRFRGTGWMPEPCRSCPERERDFGGCRCQAALLTGDAANTDPACGLSPYHETVADQVERVSSPLELDVSRVWSWRRNPSEKAPLLSSVW
ncbi:MAG TPA: pyrroloquinoline quinone biosynthesis protein PqqE [Gemmataceae bacterium]